MKYTAAYDVLKFFILDDRIYKYLLNILLVSTNYFESGFTLFYFHRQKFIFYGNPGSNRKLPIFKKKWQLQGIASISSPSEYIQTDNYEHEALQTQYS